MAFRVIIGVLLIALLEAGAFILSFSSDSFFSHDARVTALIHDTGETYSSFLDNQYDGLTGWRNPRSFSRKVMGCTGIFKTYSYDVLGARRGGGLKKDPESVDIIVVGDSFTHGDEANDEETYPAQRGRLTGTGVANHGVGGFGPLQAVLRFEQLASAYPNARIGVLGIMYENIRRLANAYQPVYYKESMGLFFFKPHMALKEDGTYFVVNPNGPKPLPFDNLAGLAKEAFQKDFWAKHEARFPYSLNLIRNLVGNYVLIKAVTKFNRWVGLPVFGLDYRRED